MFKHFQQTQEWKRIKELAGNEIINLPNTFIQLTSSPIGKVGYVPPISPLEVDLHEVYKAAKKADCIFVKIDLQSEGNVNLNKSEHFKIKKSKSIRLQNDILVDLTKSEEDLKNDIHRKVNYNIRSSIKKSIKTEIGYSDELFERFLKLYLETKKRHNYSGRGEEYLRNVWKVFSNVIQKSREELKSNLTDNKSKAIHQELQPHVLISITSYKVEDLVAWFMIRYGDTLFYPYGGSSLKHKRIRATYGHTWNTFLELKKIGIKTFDWMGIEVDKKGEVLKEGFGGFKSQFGGRHVRYTDSVDLVISSFKYSLFQKLLWLKNILRR